MELRNSWRRVFKKSYKGHIDKTKGGWNQGREVGMAGVVGEWWGVNADNSTWKQQNISFNKRNEAVYWDWHYDTKGYCRNKENMVLIFQLAQHFLSRHKCENWKYELLTCMDIFNQYDYIWWTRGTKNNKMIKSLLSISPWSFRVWPQQIYF